MLRRFPDVRVDHDNKYFYWGLLNRRFLVNRCDNCRQWHTPPYAMCPECWSRSVTPTQISGSGWIALLTVYHIGPPTEGVDYSHPYPLAGVELAEQPGLRVAATIVGCEPGRIEPGLPVQLTWIERGGNPFPAFELTTAPGENR